jgi:plastocyanin
MPRVMRPDAMIGKRMAALATGGALLLGLPACQIADNGDDLVAGKQAFVAKCGSCHVLNRAGTTGVAGPNLDEAFHRSLKDGMKRSTVKGVVHRQIEQPNERNEFDPFNVRGKPGPLMPKDLVTGDLARDVAAYVAYATARRGKDAGRLADVGVKKAKGTATASNGKLDIPADPGGALAYAFASATAPAGPLEIDSKNASQVPHDISLEGPGLDEHGQIVQGGGVSVVKADLKPGDYTFYCSVPGHREGGMVGKLTVK